MTDVEMQCSAASGAAAPMEIDNAPPVGRESNRNKPYFGTTRHFQNVDATVECSKTMQELFEEYKTFSLLKKQDEMKSNQEAGDSAYLISAKWFNSYMSYLLFDNFKNNESEDQIKSKVNFDTHFTEMHPGLINNDSDLCELDKDLINLCGTGNVKGFEGEYIDTYVEYQKEQNRDFYILNEEIWKFLLERFGGQTIWRRYARSSNYGNWM